MNEPGSRERLVSDVPPAARRHLLDAYTALLAACDAGAALTEALESAPPSLERPIHILAIGKAAPSMARHAVRWLTSRGVTAKGGVVIGAAVEPPPHPTLAVATGGHPVPDAASREAAALLRAAVGAVARGDTVWLLLSGGASSLVAAPIAGVARDDLAALFDLLLASGLDIAGINAVRKRFTVWGGGRLAAALAPARIEQFLVSDVPGDDPSVIGSGPAAPDPTSITEVRTLLERGAHGRPIPETIASLLAAVPSHPSLATLRPGAPAFKNVASRIVASNRTALLAGARALTAAGYRARIVGEPLAGEAASAGVRVAREARAAGAHLEVDAALLWGGEPTVTLPAGAPPGGRCQELALAAAGALARPGGPARITVLAAGTDGRDGPTEAAGAIVAGSTWTALIGAGRDPEADLRSHRAHAALGAVGALLPRRETGTNVMDVVVALLEAQASVGEAPPG